MILIQFIRKNLILIAFAVHWLAPSIVFARPPCIVCEEGTVESSSLACADGHSTCARCVKGVLRSTLENPSEFPNLKINGLLCSHTDLARYGKANQCRQYHPFESIRSLLSVAELTAVDHRLSLAVQPETRVESRQRSTDHIERLRRGVEEAFSLSCSACKTPFLDHEGCNAVTCRHHDCKNDFCMLCLQSFGRDQSQAAHAHVRLQHGGFWETRIDEFDSFGGSVQWPYIKRYHWLIARKKLGSILSEEIEPEEKSALLVGLERFLRDEDRMMWPMPAGQPTEVWVEAVNTDAEIAPKKKIWLLQNEALYLREAGKPLQAGRVEGNVRALGGTVLAMLDPLGPSLFSRAPEIFPVLEDHPRFHELSEGFRALGNSYEAAGSLWSGVATQRMSQRDAMAFCAGIGARLPTREDYLALTRAMGARDPENEDLVGYRQNLLPDMYNRWFWSSSMARRGATAVYFGGNDGYFNDSIPMSGRSVRCIQ